MSQRPPIQHRLHKAPFCLHYIHLMFGFDVLYSVSIHIQYLDLNLCTHQGPPVISLAGSRSYSMKMMRVLPDTGDRLLISCRLSRFFRIFFKACIHIIIRVMHVVISRMGHENGRLPHEALWRLI